MCVAANLRALLRHGVELSSQNQSGHCHNVTTTEGLCMQGIASPTSNLPQTVCDGPVLEHSAQRELAGALQLRVDRRVHFLHAVQEDVWTGHAADGEVGAQHLLDLSVERRVKCSLVDQLLEQVLCEVGQSGDAVSPLSLNIQLPVAEGSIQNESE